MDPAIVEVVTSWRRPTNVFEVRSFLGLASYYRRFVENFSRIAELTHLTQKGIPFVWDDSCEKAFNELKYHLTTALVLALSERGLGYVIYCDASRL